jgi:hypothetical protein
MIILWVRKRKAGEQKESFEKHDEIMKKFHASHPDREVKIVDSKDILTTGGNLLAPADPVKLEKHKQN